MATKTDTPPGALLDPLEHPTLTLAQAGAIVGVSKSRSYELAASGAWPVIRVSPRRWRVVTARFMREVLGLNPDGTSATD